ncbi:hypothetical protein L1049_002954 [Liquidambar formosana]|uniref:Plastid movement impaired 2 n=1 Tax=Liquidambar formosana TaxID=63359 RepID=A0AAP0R7T8_LIQFO
MGNSIGGRRKAKVMKVDGEILKFKTPVRAGDVVKDYPGHVLLESEAVKQFGIRAKPLEPLQELKPKKIYFIVELPKFPEENVPRRARSAIQMSAKDRLECLMLSRRSVSDLSVIRPTSQAVSDHGAGMRVKMRLPKAQVAKLVEESRDEAEVAQRIMDLYMVKENTGEIEPEGSDDGLNRRGQWKPGLDRIGESFKAREKRVGFALPMEGREISANLAS